MSGRAPSLSKSRPRGTINVSARQLEAHRMHFEDGKTVVEVAAHYGVSVHCVHDWYARVDASLADARNLRALGIA
jgi:transposase